jgi:outer membrane immunogenic protein
MLEAVMKKLSFSVMAFTALIAGSAMAADLGAPVYAPSTPVAPWTGIYIGGDIGWFDVHQSATTIAYPGSGFGPPPIVGTGVTGFGNLPTAHTLNGSGFLGGVHVGYNLQRGNWVFGLEGDVMWLNYHVSDVETVFATPVATLAPTFSMFVSARNNWLASGRGRLGWVMGPWMLYGTAGMAFTNSSYTATAGALPAAGLGGVGATNTFWDTKTGYVVGGGVEWMLSSNWLLRAEYLHYGFGTTEFQLPLVFGNAFGACGPGACYWTVNSSNPNIDSVRVGLSYKL